MKRVISHPSLLKLISLTELFCKGLHCPPPIPAIDPFQVFFLIQPASTADFISHFRFVSFVDHPLASAFYRVLSKERGFLGFTEVARLFGDLPPSNARRISSENLRSALLARIAYLAKLEIVRRDIVNHEHFVATEIFRKIHTKITYAQFILYMYTSLIQLQ